MSDDQRAAYMNLALAVEQTFQRLIPIIKRAIRAIQKLVDELMATIAGTGIAELEMDLKLRSEVGLRTDLLALFDP